MRATPAIKKAPTAPSHPFHRKPSNAGKMKLTITAIHCTCRSCQQTSLSFWRSATLSYWLIVAQLEKEPSDVRIEESFRNEVRILIMIHMLMMAAMFTCPHQNRVLESGRAKDENKKPNWPACLESNVREKPVIT